MKWLVLAGSSMLLACSGIYRVQSTTPVTMEICYDPFLRFEQRAADDATAHCAARGLVPVIAHRGRCGFAGANEQVTYECRRAP